MKAGMPLSPGSRLLHVGIPKSGTSALQRAAARNRIALLEHGVRYPGSSHINHRIELATFLEPANGDSTGNRRYAKAWQRLCSELDTDDGHRVLLSWEGMAHCTDEQVARLSAALGPRLHVAVSLRTYGEILPSGWQQSVKSRRFDQSFDDWLSAILLNPADPRIPPEFNYAANWGGLIRRWVSTLGADRVWVVIGEKRRPDLMTDAFAGLLSLPPALLRTDPGDRLGSNRALTLAEAETIRAAYELLPAGDENTRHACEALIRRGAIDSLLASRTPDSDETALRLPQWAADKAAEWARAQAREIEATGAHVLGDLNTLFAPVPTGQGATAVTSVPLDVAATAVAGVVVAANWRPVADRVTAPAGGEARQRPARSIRPGGRRARASIRAQRKAWRQATVLVSSVPTSGLLAVVALRSWEKVATVGRGRAHRNGQGPDL